MKYMKTSRILVTGGAGMIGSNLVKALLSIGNCVSVVDNLWRGKRENLFDGKDFIIDMNNNFFERDLSIPNVMDDIISEYDYVIHLADIVAGINFVFSNQGSIFRQNILINSNIIDSVKRKAKNLKGFLYVGTACSFPLTKQNSLDVIPLKEEELYPAYPESAYGWSKLMGQYETELLEKETGIPCCTLMLHNVYGTPCDFSPERSQVIPSLIRKAVNYPKEDFVVWGSGLQGRAFLHVFDVVNGIILALEKGWGEGAIQIGPSVCTSIKEIAESIVEISQKDIKIEYDLTKPEGDKARSADYSKAKEILGWEPKANLKDSLKEMYNWIEGKL